MVRFLLGLALFGVLAGCSPGPASEFRLGTFNLKNFAAADSDEKRVGLSRVLEALDADVLLLEEVGGSTALDILAGEPWVARRYGYRIRLEDNDPRGFGLALLASFPPGEAKSHRDDSFGAGYRYTRDCLEVHFDLGAARLALLGVHFRAQLADDPEHRLAEAERTRELAEEALRPDPELRLAVLGDFNDVPGSPPLEALTSGEPPLTGVVATLPASERWTIEPPGGQGGGELFDDVLVNPLLGAALEPATVTVLHDHDLPPELAWVSDHAPVAASFRVRGE